MSHRPRRSDYFQLVTTLAGVFIMTFALKSPGKILREWSFDSKEEVRQWTRVVNHMSEVRYADGCLQGRLMDWDPWVTSPLFELPASPWQVVEVRLKSDCGGDAEIFWTNTTKTEHGGFSGGKETHFQVIGDNRWHTYRIFPFWQKEGKIIMLRLDFPRPKPQDMGHKTVAVDWLRIVELDEPKQVDEPFTWDFSTGKHLPWTARGVSRQQSEDGATTYTAAADQVMTLSSPLMRCAAEEAGSWLVVEMAVDKGDTAVVSWAAEACKGRCSTHFALEADGRFHTYNIDLAVTGWSGTVMLLELTPSDAVGAEVRLRRIRLSPDPLGPPDIRVRHAGLENAINRPGHIVPFLVTVFNAGGEVCQGLKIKPHLAGGLHLLSRQKDLVFPDVAPRDVATITLSLRADKAGKAIPIRFRLRGPGAPTQPVETTLRIDPPLHLPKADYVPEPHPVASDYEIGALYFPGWPTINSWARIWPVAPERKPVLGWYDEGNPECVDWQIKWAVENGLSYFLVDWYWKEGSQHLDHWVKAFQKARYRHYLKWAVMWANHNPPGGHSVRDQRNVTQFWIDNYFVMPEYYRINDMPVVMIWSPSRMNSDMAGKGGAKRLLDVSREMARKAGYKGIWFIAMKWPEASTEAKDVQWLADAGFDMTSIYHYMHHGGKAKNPRHFSFELVAESSYPFWKARQATDILPFLPNLSTGWDSRPWHGDRSIVIHGRTVERFRRICRDAKRFADETGIKRLVLAPLNEWGEGSYAEPCAEFGFGMYEAVRDTFCRKPASGWPPNYGPADVGLGPYDLAAPTQLNRTEWDFVDGDQGWKPMMGIGDFAATGGSLRFTCTSRDPALSVPLNRLNADNFDLVMVRIKVDPNKAEAGSLQLFWSTRTQAITEATSVRVPLQADGQFHNLLLPVGTNPHWRGKVTGFRLDPGSLSGARITIDHITILPKRKTGE